MDIVPAIDLMNGKCVRLIQGEYHRQITYGDDPAEQAREFVAAGADRLHIVDLDGARLGKPVNIEAVKAIAESVDMKIEVGGGIRDDEAIGQMLDIGVAHVIIGTSAVSEYDWFTTAANQFSGKLILSLDARGSKVAIQGWETYGTRELWEFAAQAASLPLAAIIYTDISKDGMMAGPNFERTKALVDAVAIPIIAAGGVTEIDDIIKLKELGVAGAIIGRALYEGKIDLRAAIEAAQEPDQDNR